MSELVSRSRIHAEEEIAIVADNKSDVGSPDRDRIAMSEDHDVRYWTQALGVSKERLQEAVDAV